LRLEPCWTDDVEDGRLENVSSGKRDTIDNAAFFEDDETSLTMTFGVVRGCVADRDVMSGMTRP
jgi:hypothetical protein